MPNENRTVVVCSCEDTMTLDTAAIGRGCPGAKIETARHLCRTQLATFRKLAAEDGPLTVACTQEAPLFQDVAEDEQLAADLTFVNIRETAGWGSEGRNAAAKMAALIAAAAETDPPVPQVTFESEGVTLIYGRGQSAVDAAEQLRDKLDLTVIVTGAEEIVPPRRSDYPIRKGRIGKATGHLGAFELTIEGYAEPLASSRSRIEWGTGRATATSTADLVIDLSGGAPLFTAHDLREGYLRADPADPIAVQKVLFKAADLVGTFDKPKYIAFKAELCAHSRSRKIGCQRCLDVCPAGAIAPAGDTVAIDADICGGCGACAAVCPTGAASYALPPADVLMRRLRALLGAYTRAGGQSATVLFHDGDHGAAMIDAAARFGDGLPARVLPVAVNEVTQVGLEAIAAAFAYGAVAVRFLTRAKPKHDATGLVRTIAAARPILAGLGYGEAVAGTIETDDPDAMVAALRDGVSGAGPARPASFLAMGGKRDVLNLALRELQRAAPSPVETIALPAGAPFGRVNVNVAGCTLCLACVSACPTSALSDSKDKPLLKFDESLCVQCGLCQSTCPERVITLEPRIDFAAFERGPIVVKEEEPFCCISCGKAFGTRSTIERIVGKLKDQHWMFKGEHNSRLDLIRMCDTCRIEKVTNAGIDPYAAAPRPIVRTTEDYFKERAAAEEASGAAQREQDMLDKINRGEV